MTLNIDSMDADASSTSSMCFGCSAQNFSTPSRWPHSKYRIKTSLHGGETEATVTYTNNGGLSNAQCPARPSTSIPSKRKHLKASRWQRHKKRRLSSSEEASSVCPEVNTLSNKDNHGKRSRQYRWQRRKVSSQEACTLSHCTNMNTNDDLLTDHIKVFPFKNLQGCNAFFFSSSCVGVRISTSILPCQAEIISHKFTAYLKL